MKKLLSIISLVLLSIVFSLFQTGCKKEVIILLPTVTTSTVTNITTSTATGGGNVTGDGGAPVTSRGICWNTTQNPTLSLTKASAASGYGTGSFTGSITGLNPGTTYYVRAYATNSKGTAYGTQEQFSTTAVLATLTTTAASSITSGTATSGGNITSDGGSAITAKGVCWSTTQNPTISDSKTTDGTGSGTFTSSITGLAPATTYYIRSYATNSIGTAYGLQVNFTTLAPSYPGTTLLAVKSGGIWWAPVNAGYTQTTLPYGLLFQWNRKYGQDYVTTGVVTGGVTLIVGNDVANKDVFYSHVEALSNWTSTTGQSTWNMTDYNPCPAGWRVPTISEHQALVNTGSTWISSGGTDNLAGRWFGGNHSGDHAGSVFLPATGLRSLNGLVVSNRGLSGHYWSSNTGLRMSFDASTVVYNIMYESFTYNAYGFSVRCVRN